MTNSVSSSQSKKRTISSFFAGVGGIELVFKQTGEFRFIIWDYFTCLTRLP